MRLPRFRVRTLMIAVGLAALLVWGLLMAGQSYHYSQRAELYGMWEREWRENAKRDLDRGATQTAAAKWGIPIAEYYAPLAAKYRRAMRRPWAPVAPDPPSPHFHEPEAHPPYIE